MISRLLLVAFNGSEAEAGSGFAAKLELPFDILCLTGSAADDLGAEKILAANMSEVPNADGLGKAIATLCDGYTHIASVSTMRSKDVLARVAGFLDTAMITDAVDLVSPTCFKRPIVAGSIIATVEVMAPRVAVTFRPTGFPMPDRGGRSETVSITMDTSSRVKRVGSETRGGSRPDLAQAKVVVSGGRPLRDAETFERLIGGLADLLGGAAGATRAAVDSGIASNELQVGQTGKIVAPDLYIAVGISGSTQHMAGIKDSKVIVAINKDPDAPIFEVADLGIVADLYDAIPALMEALDRP